MSLPDFRAMSQKELHDYFLAHRDDQEAFYSYGCRSIFGLTLLIQRTGLALPSGMESMNTWDWMQWVDSSASSWG